MKKTDTATTTDNDATAPGPAMDHLCFVAGGQDFCLPVGCVYELRAWTKPTPLPLARPSLLGVINLRGSVLPVIDLARELGLPESGAPPTRPVIMVIGVDQRRGGFLLDSVRDIQPLPLNRIEPPPGTDPGFIAGIALVDGTVLRILDPGRLMPAPAADSP